MKLVCLDCKNTEGFVKEVIDVHRELIDGNGEFLHRLDSEPDTQDAVCEICESINVIDTDYLINKAPNNIILLSEGKCWAEVEDLEDIETYADEAKEGYLAKNCLSVWRAINALDRGLELHVLYKDYQDYAILKQINTKNELKEIFGHALDSRSELGHALDSRSERCYVLYNTTSIKPIEVIKNELVKTIEPVEEEPKIKLVCLNCGETENFETEMNVTKRVVLNSLGELQSESYSNEGEFNGNIKCASCSSEKVYNAKEICDKLSVDMIVSLDKHSFSDVDSVEEFEEFYQGEPTYIPRESALTLKEAFEALKDGKELIAAEIEESEGYHILHWFNQLSLLCTILEVNSTVSSDKNKHISFHRAEDLKPISMLKEKLNIQ